jgi:Flp pilus assembly protein TadG
MLEFAIVAPVLLALLLGILEFGRFFFLYHVLLTAAREGARLGAVTPMGSTAERTAAADLITTTVRARITDPQAASAPVEVTLPSGIGTQQTVRVTVRGYPFTAVVPGLTPPRLPDVRAEFRYELQ